MELFVVLILIGFAFYTIWGIGSLFTWAAEQGFIGVVIYFVCWIFGAPIMIIACFVAGVMSHIKG